MARMYPTQIASDTSSKAERVLFRELETQLSNDYRVFHSVGWKTRDGQRDAYGETDFLIAHPRRGLAVIEVKGGQLEGNAQDERWTSINWSGQRFPTTNPIRQAAKAIFSLGNALRDGAGTRAYQYPKIRWAVAFPDMLIGDSQLGLLADRANIIDSSNLNSLDSSITALLGPGDERFRLSSDALDALSDLIAPPVTIAKPGLAYQVAEGNEAILQLTQNQWGVMRAIQRQSQAVINGCAGSGKTLLAIQKAIRLAQDGHDVLLTCFNKSLSRWMREDIAARNLKLDNCITVSNYHDLAISICREAGIPTRETTATQEYWNEDLPADLSRAIALLDRRFDAIVVDEGQDFRDTWWLTLQEMLAHPDAVFYIFQDTRQAIYQSDHSLPIASSPLELSNNVRSTRELHREIVRYYPGNPKPESEGPEGRVIEFVDPGPKSILAVLGSVLDRLFREEGMLPHQVTVLTPHGESRSDLKSGIFIGNRKLVRAAPAAPNEILVSSIHSYKGLENDVVILAETAYLATRANATMLTYVALSRARHHVIVIGELPPAQE